MEKTLIIIKPDAVQRQLVGAILARFEQRGLKFAAMTFMQVPTELAQEHYAVHKGRPFYDALIAYITSAPVVALVLEGPDAIRVARNTVGGTNPVDAAPGTIRGDYGLQIGRNLVHASDGPQTAAEEIALWFAEENLVEYQRAVDRWILE
ncbi:MAG: nucleoside-diphosphate kinase [Anaerolineae bacterium]